MVFLKSLVTVNTQEVITSVDAFELKRDEMSFKFIILIFAEFSNFQKFSLPVWRDQPSRDFLKQTSEY